MSRRAGLVLLTLALAVAAVAWGWLDVRQRARLDRGLSRHRTDFTVYTAASEALFRGDDPYEARSPRGWRYVYPPLLAITMRPLTWLSAPDAAFVWYLLSVGALAVGSVALARSIGAGGVRATAIALVLASPFLVQSFQRGQVTILLLALQTTAILALVRGHDVLAGFLLAIGVALRLTPLLVAGMVGIACLRSLLRREWRSALRFPAGLGIGLVLTFVVVPVVALGPQRALEVTKAWVSSTRAVYASKPGELADFASEYAIDEWSFKNQGVLRVAYAWAGGQATDTDTTRTVHEMEAGVVALGVAAAAAIAALGLGWRRLRDRRSTAFRRALAVGVVLPVFITRYVWPTHLVVVVPLLAEALAPGAARGRRLASAVVVAAATAAFYLDHLSDAHTLARYGVLLAGLAGAVVLL